MNKLSSLLIGALLLAGCSATTPTPSPEPSMTSSESTSYTWERHAMTIDLPVGWSPIEEANVLIVSGQEDTSQIEEALTSGRYEFPYFGGATEVTFAVYPELSLEERLADVERLSDGFSQKPGTLLKSGIEGVEVESMTNYGPHDVMSMSYLFVHGGQTFEVHFEEGNRSILDSITFN